MQPTPLPSASTPALQPLGIGDVIDRVFAVYRARAIGLFVLGEILFVSIIVAWIVLAFIFILAGRSSFQQLAGQNDPIALLQNPAFFDVIGSLFLYFIVAWLATLLIGAVLTGAVIDAASAAHLGQERSLAASFTTGVGAALRIFLAGLLASLALFAVGIVYNILLAVIQNGLLAFVVTLAYFFAIFYLEASWFVYPVVATIEKKGPIASLGRSWHLATGFRWRIVGLFILLIVLVLVLLLLLLFLIGIVSAANQGAGAIITFIVLFAAIPLWMPLFFGTMTVLYYDLRVRKEGLDLQLAAEAMPRA